MYKMSDMPLCARPILEQLIEFSDDGLIRIHPKFIMWLQVSRFKFNRPDLALRCAADCKTASLHISQLNVCADSICQKCDIRFLVCGVDNILTASCYFKDYLKACGVLDSWVSIEVGMDHFFTTTYLLLHFENRLR